METRYWPFDVGPLDKLSEEDRHIVAFLKTAHLEGFVAYDLSRANYGATAADRQRTGEIIRRGRGRWELFLCGKGGRVLGAYLDNFDSAAEAVLAWLRGSGADAILPRLQSHLVVPPGASRSFTLNLPQGAVEQAVPAAVQAERR